METKEIVAEIEKVKAETRNVKTSILNPRRRLRFASWKLPEKARREEKAQRQKPNIEEEYQ